MGRASTPPHTWTLLLGAEGSRGDVRAFAAAGGLMSYGAIVSATFHQAGVYIGRILHSEKPGDLPVMCRPSSTW